MNITNREKLDRIINLSLGEDSEEKAKIREFIQNNGLVFFLNHYPGQYYLRDVLKQRILEAYAEITDPRQYT